jgi:ATP-dependent Zn protease
VVPQGRRDEHGSGPSQVLGEQLASQIDAAVKAFLDDASEHARRILTERREALVTVAEHLKVVETIDAEELDELLGPNWTPVDADRPSRS